MTKGKKFFEIKILIVVTLTMKVDRVVVRFIVYITPCRGLVKLRTQLRLERDGYSITINDIVMVRNGKLVKCINLLT